TLAKEGVENPGRQALIEAIDKKLISEKLVSPTLRTPSANAGKLTKASSLEGAAKAETPSALNEYAQTTQPTTETAVTGSTGMSNSINTTMATFANLGMGSVDAGQPPTEGTVPSKRQLQQFPTQTQESSGPVDWLLGLLKSDDDAPDAGRPKSLKEVD